MTKEECINTIKTYDLTAELHLKNIIDESREVAQALNEFADDLERIEKKYVNMQSLKRRKYG